MRASCTPTALRAGSGASRLARPTTAATLILLSVPLTGCLATNHGVSRLRGEPGPQEFTVELEAVDLPHSADHHGGPQPAPLWTAMPAAGWLRGFELELVDARGDTVPRTVLHHFKLMTPNKRELFKPIMLRLIGAGAETRSGFVPPSVGFPLQAGDSLLATAMLHNPTGREFSGVRVRARLTYTPAATGTSPLVIYPFFMHVTPPDRESSYDIPPGRSVQSWEARPAIAGRILAFGGHLHRYGTELRFEDAITGRVLWRTRPRLDSDGEVLEIPRRVYVWHPGIRIHPDRVYRVTAVYDNPTDQTIVDGGMGTIAGIVRPRSPWPAVDRGDPLYSFDRAREISNEHGGHEHAREEGHGHEHGHGHDD